MRRNLLPFHSMKESMESLVVPATGVTMFLSDSRSLLAMELLPTLGLPITATEMPSKGSGSPSGKSLTISSRRSATPRPCEALTGQGLPMPSDANSCMRFSLSAVSILFTAR